MKTVSEDAAERARLLAAAQAGAEPIEPGIHAGRAALADYLGREVLPLLAGKA